MALGTGYERQGCFLARALEVVGERWTLLILRDCFYGVVRFSDLLLHLDISRGVLTDRLDALVAAGVLERRAHGRTVDYELTEAGRELWPIIYGLSKWGEKHLPGNHPPECSATRIAAVIFVTTDRARSVVSFPTSPT